MSTVCFVLAGRRFDQKRDARFFAIMLACRLNADYRPRWDGQFLAASITLDAQFSDSGWQGYLGQDGQTYPLEAMQSILYRRPMCYRISQELLATYQDFCQHEAAHGCGGLLHSLHCFRVSYPAVLRMAGYIAAPTPRSRSGWFHRSLHLAHKRFCCRSFVLRRLSGRRGPYATSFWLCSCESARV